MENNLVAELQAIRLSLPDAPKRASSKRYAEINRILWRLERSLIRPARIAVLGEENSGKSLLINYLLKHQVLPSGGFSGDSTQLLIRYAPEPSVHALRHDGRKNRLTSKAFGRLVKPEMRRVVATQTVIYDSQSPQTQQVNFLSGAQDLGLPAQSRKQAPSKLIEVGLPLDFLRHVEIIEVRAFPEDDEATPSSLAFRQVDGIIWCTLATQAWKDTELLAWHRIPVAHRKSALMLVTYKDAIRRGKDETKILARLQHATATFFDDIVLVSLRDAVQSLLSSDPESAKRFRLESNIQMTENAVIAMIQNLQRLRLRKAGQLIRWIAAKTANIENGREKTNSRELAARLNRLGFEFLNASPSIGLSIRAA